jgi:hypothetical protein
VSLNSLASNRVVREIAAKRRLQPSSDAAGHGGRGADDALSTRGTLPKSTEDGGTGTEDVQNALSALIEYLPAETITLYLAVASALTALQRFVDGLKAAHVYWTFAILTPALYLLIYAGKRQAQGESRLPNIRAWPWWPMFAATAAFLAWALSGPNRPYFNGDGGDSIVGLAAIVVSALLGVLGRFFVQPQPR